MVSPLDKNGADVIGGGQYGGGGIAQAAEGGDTITYTALGSFADPRGATASEYLSTREGAAGWSTQNITLPAISGTAGLAGKGTPYKAFSSDLSRSLALNGIASAGEVPIENPPIAPGAPAGYQNFYLRNAFDGSLRALLTERPPQPAQGFYMELEGASANLEHIAVASDSVLTPGAIVEGLESNLYEWSSGALQPINVMPGAVGNKTKPTAVLGSGNGESHTVSNDGKRVFWSDALLGAPALLVRENGTETVQLDASQSGQAQPGEHLGTLFQTASSDGSLAFFTSHAPLTSDARTGSLPCSSCARSGSDLYEFDVDNGTLRDLSVDPNLADQNGAEARGVLGASEDGSYVYFVAAASLAGPNAEGRAPSSEDNLYLWHEVAGKPSISFVASLTSSDLHDWSSQVRLRTARVTPDGHAVAFMSEASLTGYDNMDATSGPFDTEVYLYNAASGRLSCASCNPSGARPLAASSIPAGVPYERRALSGALYQPRALSDDGSRVFFDSGDALVPQDSNGAQDVYEYENGAVYLLSGGQAPEGAEFVDASTSGGDAFFLTRQPLVRSDTDQLVDLYDARVGGGVEEPLPAPPCEDESCKPESSPQPVFTPRGSAVFSGAGNLVPVAPGPVVKPKAKKVTHKPKRKTRKKKRAKRSRVARRLR